MDGELLNYSMDKEKTLSDLKLKMPPKTESAMTANRRNFKTWLSYLNRNQSGKQSGKDVYVEVPSGKATVPVVDEQEVDEQLLRVLLFTGIGHFVVGALGVIVLAALGAAATGGILTGWAFCCAVAASIAYSSMKWLPNSQRSTFLPKTTISRLKGYVKVYILMTAAGIVLGMATVIHGAVVLSQYAGSSPFYVFNGFVQFIPTFLYVGLGAGNLGLGIAAVIIDAILISKLYRYLKEVRRLNPRDKTIESTATYRGERAPRDNLARAAADDYSEYGSYEPPPSYHSELKEETLSESCVENTQFAFSTYAQYIDSPVDDQYSTASSALRTVETKL